MEIRCLASRLLTGNLAIEMVIFYYAMIMFIFRKVNTRFLGSQFQIKVTFESTITAEKSLALASVVLITML